jgi:hypothetical protein
LLLAACSSSPTTDLPPADTGASTDDTHAVDDTGDTADDTGQVDPSTQPLPAQQTAVAITGPNYGYDVSTRASQVTLVGAARVDTERVEWRVQVDGAVVSEGLAVLDEQGAWTAQDVPVQPGDNTLIVRAVTQGGWAEDSLVATVGEASPFTSDVVVTAGVVADLESTLHARVWVDGEPEWVGVGPSADEIWVWLEPGGTQGQWSGAVDLTLPVGETELRAWAPTGHTPPSTVRSEAPLTDAQWSEISALGAVAMDALTESPDAAVQALTDAGVTDAGVTYGGVAWTWLGVPAVAVSGEGRGAETGLPPMGPATWVPQTQASAGSSGRGVARHADVTTGGNSAWILTPFSAEFGSTDETTELAAALRLPGQETCPMDVRVLPGSATYLRSLTNALEQADALHLGSHGAVSSGSTVFALGQVWSHVDFDADLSAARTAGTIQPFFSGDREWVGVKPEFIRQVPLTDGLHDMVAFLAACNAMQPVRNSHTPAFLDRGASVVLGYTDVVDSGFAKDQVLNFWPAMRAEGLIAGLNAVPNLNDVDDNSTPASLQYTARPDVNNVTLGQGDVILDPELDGSGDWSVTGLAQMGATPANLDPSADALHATIAPRTTTTYGQGTAWYCAQQDTPVTLRWQVEMAPYENWGVAHDNFLLARVDDETSGQVVWRVGWEELRALTFAGSSSDTLGTGWQEAEAVLPAGEGTLTVIGYGYDAEKMTWAVDWIREDEE